MEDFGPCASAAPKSGSRLSCRAGLAPDSEVRTMPEGPEGASGSKGWPGPFPNELTKAAKEL